MLVSLIIHSFRAILIQNVLQNCGDGQKKEQTTWQSSEHSHGTVEIFMIY